MVLGCVVKAPSTLGTFLRSFRWGHVRQLDRVSRQLKLARAWAAGAGPGASPLTSADQGGPSTHLRRPMDWPRRERATTAIPAVSGAYHPLLAVAGAGTGDVLMSRAGRARGPGCANTARGAAHFLQETASSGSPCRGQRATYRRGPTAAVFYAKTLSSPLSSRWMSAFSITIR